MFGNGHEGMLCGFERVRDGRWRLADREREAKDSPAARAVVGPDAAAMGGDHPGADGQTQTRTVRRLAWAAKKALEEAPLAPGRQTPTAVGDFDANFLIPQVGAEFDRRAQ